MKTENQSISFNLSLTENDLVAFQLLANSLVAQLGANTPGYLEEVIVTDIEEQIAIYERDKGKQKITARFFGEAEFQRLSVPCSLQDMQQSTMDMFDKAREIAGVPFVVTSAYRSSAHDKSRGRTGTGAHTLGMAMDIRARNPREMFLILFGLIMAGFKRIGINFASNFIHADNSPNHDQNVLFSY